MIRVLIVDDHQVIREPLAFMLSREAGIEVTGQVGSVDEARPFLTDIDVAIVDLDLGASRGVDVVRELGTVNPGAHAVVVTGSTNRDDLEEAMRLGARCVLHKGSPWKDLIQAVVQLGQTDGLLRLSSSDRSGKARHERDGESGHPAHHAGSLTPRERDVLREVASGGTDKQVAVQLGVSTETVRTHMAHILSKLRVNSRAQAVMVAVRLGVLEST
ncbi:MAG TPA: response regulator transcription factor [Chloroflexota bacterium]|nr:response regulator transcription factor [Chloroflexota bacterium]